MVRKKNDRNTDHIQLLSSGEITCNNDDASDDGDDTPQVL
jgi:hypothetical protein